MVAPQRGPEPARHTRTTDDYRNAPMLWRVLIRMDRAVVRLTGRLEVTGDIPDELRGRPLLLAANHIGNFDSLVLVAACGRRRIAPRFLATGGLFDTPIVGPVLRRCGHVRADRGKASAVDALGKVVTALRAGPPILVYPEGRISLEPGLWPERGKSGVARMALAADAPVIPVSQWGAHEAMRWGMLTVRGWRDARLLLGSWVRAVRNRPRLRVHFGDPVRLEDLSPERTGDAARARDRIMRGIAGGLASLRADELEEPAVADPTRPSSGKRSPWRP